MEERARALKFRQVGIVCCSGLDELCDLGSLSFIFLSCQTGICLLNKYLGTCCVPGTPLVLGIQQRTKQTGFLLLFNKKLHFREDGQERTL